MSSEWRRLGDHCLKIGSGATPKGGKDAYLESGSVTLIRSQNIYNDGFRPAGLVFISADQAKKLDGVSVEASDVLLNITGDSVARVCLAQPQYLPARVNQHVAIIRPNPTVFDSRFLRYFLASPYQQDLMLGLAAAGATRNALTKGMIEDFKVPCPPLGEQKALADMLSALDDRIALLRETNATLEAIAQAIFKSWFVDFDPVRAKQEGRAPEGMDEATAALFPDSFEESELGLVPRGWRVGSVYEVAQVTYGAPFASSQFKSKKIGRPLIRIRDLKDESPSVFTEEVHPKGRLVLPGEIVVGMDGEFRAYLWGGEPAWLNQRLCLFSPLGDAPAAFVRLAISPLLAAVEASETATTVIHLGKNDIDRFKLRIPPSPVLKAFANVANPIYEKIVASKLQATTLAALRDALLPRLISGQLRLPDAQDAIAEAVA